jgi:hypothetical protein
MPAELQAIHRYVLETPVLENVSEEIGTVIENVWPELISKLPPKLCFLPYGLLHLITRKRQRARDHIQLTRRRNSIQHRTPPLWFSTQDQSGFRDHFSVLKFLKLRRAPRSTKVASGATSVTKKFASLLRWHRVTASLQRWSIWWMRSGVLGAWWWWETQTITASRGSSSTKEAWTVERKTEKSWLNATNASEEKSPTRWGL